MHILPYRAGGVGLLTERVGVEGFHRASTRSQRIMSQPRRNRGWGIECFQVSCHAAAPRATNFSYPCRRSSARGFAGVLRSDHSSSLKGRGPPIVLPHPALANAMRRRHQLVQRVVRVSAPAVPPRYPLCFSGRGHGPPASQDRRWAQGRGATRPCPSGPTPWYGQRTPCDAPCSHAWKLSMPGANRNSPTASLASLRPISSLLTGTCMVECCVSCLHAYRCSAPTLPYVPAPCALRCN